MMRCLAPDCQMGGLGCDNMTVILICFLHGGTYEQLSSRCNRNLNPVPPSPHPSSPITPTSPNANVEEQEEEKGSQENAYEEAGRGESPEVGGGEGKK